MTYEQIKELIALIDASSLREFELNMDNTSVHMSKNSGGMHTSSETSGVTVASVQNVQQVEMPSATPTVVVETASAVEQGGEVVKAPIVGTFYSGPGGGKPDFVRLGDKVKEGDTLCILEAMKIMNEIVSPIDGEVVEIYVENEKMVEYGQPLFRIR
jgi:acetyl-CoA carboxylase biotin carboxyl carrier protein